jgi:MYXO-CTERM domain-containing protein
VCLPTDTDGGVDADGGLTDGGDAGNQPPIAEAGPIQVVSPGTLVELDGSASRDPEGENLTFFWQQTSGPESVELTGETTARPTFTPERQGVYVFWLVVSDGTQESAPDFTEVQVEAGAESGCGCGASSPGSPQGSASLFLLVAFLAIGLRRMETEIFS